MGQSGVCLTFQSNVFQPTLPILTCQVSKFQGTSFRNVISWYACALGRSVNVSDWACIELNRSLAPLPGFGRVTFGEAKNIWIKVVLNDNQVNLDYLKITDLTGNILWEERLQIKILFLPLFGQLGNGHWYCDIYIYQNINIPIICIPKYIQNFGPFLTKNMRWRN